MTARRCVDLAVTAVASLGTVGASWLLMLWLDGALWALVRGQWLSLTILSVMALLIALTAGVFGWLTIAAATSAVLGED